MPIKGLDFGKVIGSRVILGQTQQPFAWSKANDCRFYVRVFDGTEAHEKDVNKARMRTLERRFYRYEVRDESFPTDGVPTGAADK